MACSIAWLRSSPGLVCPLQEAVCQNCLGWQRSPLPALRARGPVYAAAKYSTGDGLGEYGGPPEGGLELRKMWGGVSKDPLTDQDGYIWTKDWKKVLDEEAQRADREAAEEEARKSAKVAAGEGFLSLNRALSLDSLEVDLSQQLLKPTPATLRRQAEEESLRAAEGSRGEGGGGQKPAYKFAPTRKEERYWGKIRKASKESSKLLLAEASKPTVDKKKQAAIDRKRYEELKGELQLLCLGIGAACSVATYFTYSNEVTVSYTAGVVGSLVYLRMLSNSVDGMGKAGLGNAARSAAGQPRLLVPLVMVLALNRWNALAADNVGLHFQLIPMLVGFFTYKIATMVQTFKELLPQTDNDASKSGF